MGMGFAQKAAKIMLTAGLGLAVFGLGALPQTANAQSVRGSTGDAQNAVKSASVMMLELKGSSLPPWWRALAVARLARSQARTGDEESARVLARDAVLLMNERSPTPPPPALGPATLFAILSQAYLDMRDPQSAVQLANESLKSMQSVSDPVTRAANFAFLGLIMSEASGPEGARPLLLQGLRDAATLPAGREQIAALSMIAQAQGKLSDKASATDTLAALTGSLPSLTKSGDIALTRAYAARAAMAAQDGNAARTHIREAVAAYDRSTQSSEMPMPERVAALGLIALAYNEIGDKSAARQIVATLKQTLASISEPYDKFQGLLTLADTTYEIEQQRRP